MEEVIRTLLKQREEYGEVVRVTPTIRGFSVTLRPHPYAECLEVGSCTPKFTPFYSKKSKIYKDKSPASKKTPHAALADWR